MIVKKLKLTRPSIRHQYRNKKLIQMVDPVSKLPLTEHDSIRLGDLENMDIVIIESKPHANYLPGKKALFRSQKYYYLIVK